MVGLSEEVTRFHSSSVYGWVERRIRKASWDACGVSINVSSGLESNEDVGSVQAEGFPRRKGKDRRVGSTFGPRY
jgi:hypothetical protein